MGLQFSITPDDVSIVLLKNGRKADEETANKLFELVDQDAVTNAAIRGGDNDEQTSVALAEIGSQLKAAGHL